MLDMSWGEIMLIGGVALIVIGPKELPRALRTVGQMTSKVRKLATEFQTQFSDAMREADLEDVRKEVEGLNRQVAAATTGGFNPIQTIRDELKGAVEDKPASAVPASTDAPAASSMPVVEDAGPSHHLEPSASGPVVSHPAAPELPLELTGPGLEPGPEPRTPTGAAA